jgi:hypothetical protein
LPQDNLASCFYNHNELDLRNGFFREEEVFVWTLYKYTIKTQEICLQISAIWHQFLVGDFAGENDDLPQVMIRGG